MENKKITNLLINLDLNNKQERKKAIDTIKKLYGEEIKMIYYKHRNFIDDLKKRLLQHPEWFNLIFSLIELTKNYSIKTGKYYSEVFYSFAQLIRAKINDEELKMAYDFINETLENILKD